MLWAAPCRMPRLLCKLRTVLRGAKLLKSACDEHNDSRRVAGALGALANCFLHLLKRERRMGIGTAGAHFRGDPDRFHQFLLGGAVPQRGLGMAPNAVWALGDMRNRDSNDLLHFCLQRTIRKDLLAKGLKGRVGIGR